VLDLGQLSIYPTFVWSGKKRWTQIVSGSETRATYWHTRHTCEKLIVRLSGVAATLIGFGSWAHREYVGVSSGGVLVYTTVHAWTNFVRKHGMHMISIYPGTKLMQAILNAYVLGCPSA
jgi:hypothetical protein